MKQVLSLVAAGAVALLLTACGDNTPKQPEVKSETTVTTEQVKPAEDVKATEEAKPAETTTTTETTETKPADAAE